MTKRIGHRFIAERAARYKSYYREITLRGAINNIAHDQENEVKLIPSLVCLVRDGETQARACVNALNA
jgi:hypothetical protein